jgi:pilus assembly protein Flp/PilA
MNTNEIFWRLYLKIQDLKDALAMDEWGQDLVEYALVLSLIALAATAGMTSVAVKIKTAFTSIGTKLTNFTS